jgi:pyruvate dehydrogenase E2 component (dihydrolipoamide acetyltransferase)/2-oxoisovalerate dehydrogenase E2 component (dihydrolipoyl transacylase)
MDFRVPELGEGVYEAELVSWHVKPGDVVKRGQNLMEVMTDKATMEVPSPFAGKITALSAEPGDQIEIGQVVLTFASAGEEAAPEAPAEKKDRRSKRAAKVEAAPAVVAATDNGPAAAGPAADRHVAAVKAAPSVRLMARKLGVDLGRIPGSGPGGRILVDDLTRFVQTSVGVLSAPADEVHPDYGTPGTRVKLLGLRRKIAERMVQSKRTIPHFSYVDECDVTGLVRLRGSLKEKFGAAGVKLTLLAFFVRAVVQALREVAIVNSSLVPVNRDAEGSGGAAHASGVAAKRAEGVDADTGGAEIVLHDHYHIGIAGATPAGLIGPVIPDADKLSLAEMAREIERLTLAARSGKATREELTGGTFTITSVGNIGGLITTPIINPPEVGILGIGKVVKRPVYDAAGDLQPADLVYLSFSFDHRVLDGAIGVAFGNAVIRQLQNPAGLLLPEKLV